MVKLLCLRQNWMTMINNYPEALEHMYQINKLNESGLRDYIGQLRREIIDLKQKIIDLEFKLQYSKGTEHPKS